MTNIRFFLSENFHFLLVKFAVYLNRQVFVSLCDFLFYFIYIDPFRKGVISKRKEFAPKGSKFLPFTVEESKFLSFKSRTLSETFF